MSFIRKITIPAFGAFFVFSFLAILPPTSHAQETCDALRLTATESSAGVVDISYGGINCTTETLVCTLSSDQNGSFSHNVAVGNSLTTQSYPVGTLSEQGGSITYTLNCAELPPVSQTIVPSTIERANPNDTEESDDATSPPPRSTIPDPDKQPDDFTSVSDEYGSGARDIFVDGIVPCGRGEFWPDGTRKPDCTFCHGIILVNNLIKFMLIIAFLVGGVVLVSAGILLLLSGVNPNLRNTGKQMATATVVGLVIMVLSWVIVSTIINVLAQDNEAVRANFNLTNGSFSVNCKAYVAGSDFEL